MSATTIQSALDSDLQRRTAELDGPIRQRAHRFPVQAGHLRRHRQAGLLRIRAGPRPEPGRRAAQRRRHGRQRLEPGRPDQRDAELLALGREPGHRAGRWHHGMGGVAGRADAPRAHHRQPAHGPHQPGYGPGVFERRLHRRQPRRLHRVHRLATAVVHARFSNVGVWYDGVWNTVFSGRGQCARCSRSRRRRTPQLATTPVSREKPYLVHRLHRQVPRVRARRCAPILRVRAGTSAFPRPARRSR